MLLLTKIQEDLRNIFESESEQLIPYEPYDESLTMSCLGVFDRKGAGARLSFFRTYVYPL